MGDEHNQHEQVRTYLRAPFDVDKKLRYTIEYLNILDSAIRVFDSCEGDPKGLAFFGFRFDEDATQKSMRNFWQCVDLVHYLLLTHAPNIAWRIEINAVPDLEPTATVVYPHEAILAIQDVFARAVGHYRERKVERG